MPATMAFSPKCKMKLAQVFGFLFILTFLVPSSFSFGTSAPFFSCDKGTFLPCIFARSSNAHRCTRRSSFVYQFERQIRRNFETNSARRVKTPSFASSTGILCKSENERIPLTVTAADGHLLRVWHKGPVPVTERTPVWVLLHGRTWSSVPVVDRRSMFVVYT